MRTMHGTLQAFLPPFFTSLDVVTPILFICSAKLVSLQKVICVERPPGLVLPGLGLNL